MQVASEAPLEEVISFSIVNQVQIAKSSSFVIGDELLIDFVITNSFDHYGLETVQSLDFVDAAGNESTLTFNVNSFSYGTDILQVTYALGTHNVTGLQAKDLQNIIIMDEVVD